MDIQDAELWRQSPLAPDHVEVSNLGRVRTKARLTEAIRCKKRATQLRPAKLLSPWLGTHGYQIVTVQVDSVRKKYLVHRLVASAFCEGFSPELSVNHINGVKADNRSGNLEWVTLATNTSLQWRDGLVDLRGEHHPGSKLSLDQVRHIRKALASGLKAPSIARMLRVSPSIIYKIGTGERWATTA